MSDWTPLETELAIWDREGRRLPVWWRDDDAVTDTDALHRLAQMTEQAGLPLHIAVIPEGAKDSLVRFVARHPHVHPLVHGWAHQNHAPAGDKKAEFGAHRPSHIVAADARAGLVRLRALFGARLLPVFVPPWNRISDALIAQLPGLGYEGLSTFTPRRAVYAAPGLVQINTHIDPIDWKGSRGLLDETALIAQITSHLQDRRLGKADPGEPLGLLTHHLVHDEAIWSFCARLSRLLMAGPGIPWSFGKDPST